MLWGRKFYSEREGNHKSNWTSQETQREPGGGFAEIHGGSEDKQWTVRKINGRERKYLWQQFYQIEQTEVSELLCELLWITLN